MGKFRDLTGQKFGRLTVLCIHGRDKYGKILYLCRCDCGNKKITHGRSLVNGNCLSCGCMNIDAKMEMSKYHGLAQDEKRLYQIWKGMISRCYNEKNKSYSDYGGRGIYVCEDWRRENTGFPSFVRWAKKNGYQDNLSIDRVDNNREYSPHNCRWATWTVQAGNRRKPILVKNQYGVWNYRKPLPEPPKESTNDSR